MPKKTAHVFEDKWRSDDVKQQEAADFSSLLLSEKVLLGLKKAGFKTPSPIQLEAIPVGRVGSDLIVQAKSGTGKTLVFTIIALDLLLDNPNPQTLILAPTREIAFQICDVIRSVGSAFKSLKCGVFIGGIPIEEDRLNILGCQIIVGTPGRIKQLISLRILNTSQIRIFVMDEADVLLEQSFKIAIDAIFVSLPKEKQIIATSATYPRSLRKLVERYFPQDPYVARLNVNDLALLGTLHYVYIMQLNPMPVLAYRAKLKALESVLTNIKFAQCLVFCNSVSRVESICEDIKSLGFSATYISSAKEQTARLKAIDMLKRFKCKVLVSSDVTSRGIDAENVDLIINVDTPFTTHIYLHRVGRAGRFGSKGLAITFVPDNDIEAFKVIRKEGNFKAYLLPDPIPGNLINQRPDPRNEFGRQVVEYSDEEDSFSDELSPESSIDIDFASNGKSASSIEETQNGVGNCVDAHSYTESEVSLYLESEENSCEVVDLSADSQIHDKTIDLESSIEVVSDNKAYESLTLDLAGGKNETVDLVSSEESFTSAKEVTCDLIEMSSNSLKSDDASKNVETSEIIQGLLGNKENGMLSESNYKDFNEDVGNCDKLDSLPQSAISDKVSDLILNIDFVDLETGVFGSPGNCDETNVNSKCTSSHLDEVNQTDESGKEKELVPNRDNLNQVKGNISKKNRKRKNKKMTSSSVTSNTNPSHIDEVTELVVKFNRNYENKNACVSSENTNEAEPIPATSKDTEKSPFGDLALDRKNLNDYYYRVFEAFKEENIKMDSNHILELIGDKESEENSNKISVENKIDLNGWCLNLTSTNSNAIDLNSTESSTDSSSETILESTPVMKVSRATNNQLDVSNDTPPVPNLVEDIETDASSSSEYSNKCLQLENALKNKVHMKNKDCGSSEDSESATESEDSDSSSNSEEMSLLERAHREMLKNGANNQTLAEEADTLKEVLKGFQDESNLSSEELVSDIQITTAKHPSQQIGQKFIKNDRQCGFFSTLRGKSIKPITKSSVTPSEIPKTDQRLTAVGRSFVKSRNSSRNEKCHQFSSSSSDTSSESSDESSYSPKQRVQVAKNKVYSKAKYAPDQSSRGAYVGANETSLHFSHCHDSSHMTNSYFGHGGQSHMNNTHIHNGQRDMTNSYFAPGSNTHFCPDGPSHMGHSHCSPGGPGHMSRSHFNHGGPSTMVHSQFDACHSHFNNGGPSHAANDHFKPGSNHKHSDSCVYPSQHRCHNVDRHSACQSQACANWYSLFYKQWNFIQQNSHFH